MKVAEDAFFWIIGKNKWSKENFSEYQAREKSKTLKNCVGCKDCENCKNCTWCIGCTDCIHCDGCIHCHNCNHCKECYSCKNIMFCLRCNRTDDIMFSKDIGSFKETVYEIKASEKDSKENDSKTAKRTNN